MSGGDIETLQALMRRHGIAEVLYEDAKGRVLLPAGRSDALPSARRLPSSIRAPAATTAGRWNGSAAPSAIR